MAAWNPPPAAPAGDRSPCSCPRRAERRCTRASTAHRPSPPRSALRNGPAPRVLAARGRHAAISVQARALFILLEESASPSLRGAQAIQAPSFRDGALAPDPESRDSGFDAEPVIEPANGRTRWHGPEMTVSDSAIAMTEALIFSLSSLIQKIQRQPGPRPVHRDEFALAGQRDVGGFQVRPAERDVGGDAVAGRHLLDDGTVGRDHRNAARDQGR